MNYEVHYLGHQLKPGVIWDGEDMEDDYKPRGLIGRLIAFL